jgi:LPXTG-site transpeptidase (sortase) family protein
MGQFALPPGDPRDIVLLPRRGSGRGLHLNRVEWLQLVAALGFTIGGLVFIAMAAGWSLGAREAESAWVASPEGQEAARVVAEPTPIWVPAGAAPLLAESTPATGQPSAPLLPAIVPGPPSVVQLLSSSFVFLDPPEPGARARVAVGIRVIAGATPASVTLGIPLQWFDGYRVATTEPSASVENLPDPGFRRLTFSNIAPGEGALELDVVAKAERVDPPDMRVTLEPDGDLVGEAHPRTIAPRPRPGPVSALRIPRLNLKVAVVPTAWEPPAFVAGQIRDSAKITLGNTVLVGHLGGAAGDVFKNLDDVQLGDTVVAVSRGLEYTFVVSQKEVRPGDDSGPTLPTSTPRMTLMTCTGTWDPVTRQYSDRLWVTAEPWDLAAKTIKFNASRPPTPVPAPTPDGSPTPDPALAPLAVGLGAERAQLDEALGPPLGETPGKLVVYRQGSIEYHVRFTPDPARAELISFATVASGGALPIPTAVEDAHAEFPTDAEMRTQAPDGPPNLVVERYASPALAQALGGGSGADAGDAQVDPTSAAGNFIAAYARDATGGVKRVVMASGDDPDQALLDAAR